MLQQEFAPLESFGQLLANGLLDHPRTRKSNNAPGSAIFKSPSMAKLAVTPPVVGSVRTLMYGIRPHQGASEPR